MLLTSSFRRDNHRFEIDKLDSVGASRAF